MRALIVDDRESDRSWLRSLLEDHGFEVCEAGDGAEALARARETAPSFVVADVLMPVMDGYTLLRHWNTDPALRLVPFIVHTATHNEPEDEQAAIALGAAAFVVKPADPAVFLRTVEFTLQRWRDGRLSCPQREAVDPVQVLASYNAVLVARLEDRAQALEAANRALRESEARYHGLFDNLHAAMLVIDPTDGRIADANAAAARYYGWSRDELCRMAIGQINTLPPVQAGIHMLEALSGRCQVFHFTHRTASGVLRDVEVHSGPVRLDGRTLLLSVVHDETERRAAERSLVRLNRLLEMLSQTNHVLVRATREDDLYRGVCEAAVVQGGFRFAWIARVDESGALRPVARFGEDGGYIDALDASADPASARSCGPASRAVRTGECVVANDFLSDATTAPVHEAARAAGIRASAALPLRSGGEVIGCLSLYSDTLGVFGRDEVATLGRMAADVSFGLDGLAQRAALEAASQVVEASPVVLFRWAAAPDRPIEFVSTNVAQWGYAASTLLADRRAFSSIVHPGDMLRLREEIRRYLDEGRNEYTLRYRIRDAQGRTRWVEDVTSVVRGTGGCVERFQGAVNDITERHRAQQALVSAEAQYRNLFEANPHPMWLFDEASMRFLAVNHAAVAHYGWTRDEFMRMTIADIRPPEDVQRLAEWRARPRTRSLANAGIWRHLRKDRSVIDVRITSSAVRFAGRHAVLVLAHDVTSELRAQQQLRERTRLVAMAGRLASLGGWEVALAEGVVYWSDEVCRIHDMPVGTRVPIDEGILFYAPEWRARITERFTACAAEGVPYDEELEILTASGRRVWVRTVGQPVRNEAGAIVRVEGAFQDITLRKQAEQRLRDSEQFALATLDSLSAHIAIVDEDGIVTAVNGAWRRFAEENPPARGLVCEGASYLAVCDAATGAEAAEAHAMAEGIRAVLAGSKDEFAIEYPCHAPHEQRWFVASVTPFAGRGARRAVVAHENITTRKLAELALADSERRFHATFEQAAVGIARVAPDGSWLEVNEKLCGIVGYRRDELLSRRFQDITHPDDLEADLAQMKRVLAGDLHSYTLEKRYLRKEGSIVWVDLTVGLVRDTTGQPDYFVSVVEDMTARKLAQEEVRKLSQAVEQSAESILITDAEGTIEYVNDSLVQRSGYAREELIGRNPRLLQSGATPRATYESMWAALKAGRAWNGEFHNRRKDGTEYVEAAVITPLRSPAGVITHYVGVKEDITQKRRTQQELDRYRTQLEGLVRERTAQLEEARREAEAANAAKSAFLANMSHEIRTPMNGVLGMLEVLSHGMVGDDEKDLARIAQESGRTLLAIIDDILDFSKIEAGRMQILAEPVAVRKLVEGLCESLVPAARQRNVDLDVFVDPGIPGSVITDALRLRQILMNLAGNAIKFSGGNATTRGWVAVRVDVAQAEPLKLGITVSDNGIGMDEETIARLFTPFTQAEASTTRRYGGSGLGLTICRRLVDLMEGGIEVQSSPGRGTTFRVVLPCKGSAILDRSPVDLGGLHCMVVESAASDSTGLATYLEHAGARVTRCAATDLARHMSRVTSQSTVVIDDADCASEMTLPPGVGRVLLASRWSRRARLDAPGVASLDRNAIRRDVFVRAVAAAAGREALVATDDSAPAGPVSAAEPARAAGDGGGVILVAEDDEVNRQVIVRQLGLLGRRAEVASDGKQAFAMWRTGAYSLLLTDLHMPEMDGYTLSESIRGCEATADPGACRLPIIALTANALRGEADRAHAAGMDAYLTKPLQLAQLREMLDHWLPATPAGPCDGGGRASAIDVDALASVLGTDVLGVRELLTVFQASAGSLERALGQAAEDGDLAAAASAMHRLKSAARSLGAVALANLAVGIEEAAQRGDLAAVRAALPAFSGECRRVSAEIDASRASPGT